MKGCQQIDRESTLKIVHCNLFGFPDELANAVVEVRGEETENEVAVEEYFCNGLNNCELLPQILALTKTTILDRVDVNEEQGEGYEDSLIDCGKDDANVPVEQEVAFFR